MVWSSGSIDLVVSGIILVFTGFIDLVVSGIIMVFTVMGKNRKNST